MVFYNGKEKYSATTELSELFTHPELARQSLAGYKLIDLSKMDKETLLHNKMLAFLEYVMQPKKKFDIIEVYKGLSESLKMLVQNDREDLIIYIIKRSTAYYKKHFDSKKFTKEKGTELRNVFNEISNNPKIIDKIMYGTFAQQYVEEGRQEGIPEGIQIGKQEERRHMAEKMLRAKKPIEEIMMFTELSEQEIAEIKHNMK